MQRRHPDIESLKRSLQKWVQVYQLKCCLTELMGGHRVSVVVIFMNIYDFDAKSIHVAHVTRILKYL